jgi:hypothetical protein
MKVKGYVNGKVIDVDFVEPEKDPIFEIQQLKQKLADTDYIACKIAEGSATAEEYADIIADRQKWREEINAYESELKNRGL